MKPRTAFERATPPQDKLQTAVGFEALYREQQPVLLRLFARCRISQDDARDLTHEAFLKLSMSEALKTGVIAHTEAYLRTIARNLVRNQAKASLRRGDAAAADCAELPASAPCEVSRLEARDSLNRLEAVIRAMKPRTREIFMAHRLDGMSYTEIACATGLSVSGVEKHMIKALSLINRYLDLD